MIDISNWLKDGIVSGYRRGELSFTKVTELVAAYLGRGLMNRGDAHEIAFCCPAPVAAPQSSTDDAQE